MVKKNCPICGSPYFTSGITLEADPASTSEWVTTPLQYDGYSVHFSISDGSNGDLYAGMWVTINPIEVRNFRIADTYAWLKQTSGLHTPYFVFVTDAAPPYDQFNTDSQLASGFSSFAKHTPPGVVDEYQIGDGSWKTWAQIVTAIGTKHIIGMKISISEVESESVADVCYIGSPLAISGKVYRIGPNTERVVIEQKKYPNP